MQIFDFVKSINDTKQDIIADFSHVEGDYVPFIVNRNFSLFIDTLFDANAMNQRSHLPGRLQYDYLRLAVKRRKRFAGTWPKNKKNEDAYVLSQLLSVPVGKMVEALNILSNDQVVKLKSLVENVGGEQRE